MLHSTKAGQVSGEHGVANIARGLVLFAVAAIAVVLLWPQSAQAAECTGGDCSCGAYIPSATTNVTLTQDIGPCPDQWGLRVEKTTSLTPLTIDCQGHRISGEGTGANSIGIENAGGQGGGWCAAADCRQKVTVKNCVIEGFDTGIDYNDADGWVMEGNTITGRWDGTTVYPAAVGIRGSPGRDPASPTLVIDNDILEVTNTGIDLINLRAGSEIRGNRVTAYVRNKQSDPNANAGIELTWPQGTSASHITVRGNYVDCPTRDDYNSTRCDFTDLYIYAGSGNCPLPGVWLGRVDIYDNVFSGKGVSIGCDPVTTIPEINFRPPPENPSDCTPTLNNGLCDYGCVGSDYNDCQARYNIFTNVTVNEGLRDGSACTITSGDGCDPDCKMMTGGSDWDNDCVGIPQPFYYDADRYLKACEAPNTWATTKVLTENTCFQPGQTYTFRPTVPDGNRAAISFGDHSSRYGPADADVGLILDCNWAGKLTDDDTNGKLTLDTGGLPSPGTDAPKTVGILAAAARTPDGGYIPRRRGTIVACETDQFGTGIRLENSQDFLLRWNIMRRIYDFKLGFFLDVKSDHLQDLDSDADSDPNPDPEFTNGVDMRDFRHQIYNVSYRPLSSSGVSVPTPFNWVNAVQPFAAANNKQVLYFYGSGADGLTIDGTDPYFGANPADAFPNVGHLTAANVQNFTVQNFGGPQNAALGTPIASGDGVKFACVGMSHDDTTCGTRIDAPALPADQTVPMARINNVAVTGSQIGFYLFNSYRVALQNSRVGGNGAGDGNGYGVLMFGTASTTVGCNPVLNSNTCTGAANGCNCLQKNDEGLWAAAWMLPATKLLVWGNSVSGNTRDGVVLFDADECTVRDNTIADTGPCTVSCSDGTGSCTGIPFGNACDDSTGTCSSYMCPPGFNPDAVGLYLYGAKDGNIYGNTVTNSDGDNVALVQSFNGSNSAAERNFLYSNTITNSLAGRGIYAYNSIPNVAGNAFGWATAGGLPCPTAPAWPNSPCTGFSTDVWPMNLAPGSYHTTISGNARGSGMKLAYTNFDRLYRNKIEGNADGLVLYQARILDAVENQIAANAGWGVVGWDENQNFLVRNQISRNGRGGMSFAAYETQGGLPGYSTALLGNVMDGNLGPGLQFNYAPNFDVKGNRIKLPNTPSVPGVLVYNSQNVNLKGNTISSAAATPQFPYLTVSALPQSVRPVALPNVSGSEFYDHHIYQSNTAGPDSAVQTVTYQFRDGESPTDGYIGTEDTRILETAGASQGYNYGITSPLVIDESVGAGTDDTHALTKFDVSSVPTTCTVTNVSLTLFVTDITGSSFDIVEMLQSWVEGNKNGAVPDASGGATWNTHDGTNAWQTAGADGANDRNATTFGTIVDPASANNFATTAFNSTGISVVQGWVNGSNSNEGMWLGPLDNNENDGLQWKDADQPTIAQRPRLTITCTMYPPVYYFYNNREHLQDNNDVENLPEAARTVEKACLENSLNYGHRCTQQSDCLPNTGTACKSLQTKHLQLAASTKFTVQNFRDAVLANRLTGADPLRADFMAETNLTGLELADCLGPCLWLANSSGSGLAEFTLDNIVVSNPFGSGLVAAAGAGVTATNLRIVPGPGQIESNAIQLDYAGFGLGCPSGGCTALLWNGLAGNTLTLLPSSRNELVRGADAANRFWELEAAGRTLGDITYTQFTNRGAFEVSCQPGKDDCCNATLETPPVCDPDCGMNGNDPVDQDCTGASVCTSTGGNCCLAIVDGACDTDCPARVDPDCGMRATTAYGDGCSGGGDPDTFCDYDCIQDSSITTDSQDPDCKLTTCSSSKDGCCNPSDEPGAPGTAGAVCDPDCGFDILDTSAGVGANIDPDCNTPFNASSDNGCFPVTDSTCDMDCLPGADPDCGVDSTTGLNCSPVGGSCVANSAGQDSADGICNGQNDSKCDPDCLGSGIYGSSDPNCMKNAATTPDTSLCTFRASFRPGIPGNTVSQGGGCTLGSSGQPPDDDICDVDCLGTVTPDPDCTEIDCCLPKIDGACDADCPAGVDPDCIRPAQLPAVAGCQSWRDGMCDYDCPSIAFPTESPPVSGCDITINQICDPDCIGTGTPDPDCLQPDPDCPAALAVKLPAGGTCNAVQDGLCDQACAAGVDPDCGQCGLPQPQPQGAVPFYAPDGRCDADCGLNDKYGIPYDPDCGYCGSGQDGCCYAFNEYTVPRCDPDCGMKADGTPVDPDCTSGCTKTGGNCCLPVVDAQCDSDCPAGFDPDCSADIFFCGDRSFQEANKWPAAFTVPYGDDVNYPYEKGIPNGADSCMAPLIRFTADDAGSVVPDRIARQYRIPRTYSLKQRRWSRGDVFLEAQVSDFEGSDLKLGLMFSTEQLPWHDPYDRTSFPPGDGWLCSTDTPNAFWCAVSFFSAETAANQPLVPAEPAPLPLPYVVYPAALPPPPPHPSVDNWASVLKRGPEVQRIGVTSPIKTRQWLNESTQWDSGYLSTLTFYWATASSTYGNPQGQNVEWLDDRRQALWLELVSTDSGSCTETAGSGCFSGGNNVISLCDADCGAPFDAVSDCQQSCVTNDNDLLDSTIKTREGWSRRQRLVVDLKSPDAITTITINSLGSDPVLPIDWYRYQVIWPRYSSGVDAPTGLAMTGGEILDTIAAAASHSEYASWTPGNGAHYEIWYGTNKDEVIQPWRLFCSDGDVGACPPSAGEGYPCDPDGNGGSGTCRVGDGNDANGPFVWEDISQASSGMPHEVPACPRGAADGLCWDSDLKNINCNGAEPDCRTEIYTKFPQVPYILVCAVDDFGNFEKSCKFSVSVPWVQTQFGDIYAGESLTATNQSVAPNATFLITTAGSISNWSSASTAFGTGGKLSQYASNPPNPSGIAQRALPFPTYKNDFTTTAGSIWFLRKYDGSNFGSATISTNTVLDDLRARYGNSRVVDLGATMCGGGASSLPISGVLGGKVYYFSNPPTPCTIASALTFNDGTSDEDGSALFLINGDLTINNNIQYGSAAPTKLKNIASATWLVLGGVTIDPTVTTVDSNIIALGSRANKDVACYDTSAVDCGTIRTGTSEVLLKVRGIMAAREFLFQRTGSELLTGSETIVYDGRLLANPPPGLDDLMQSLPVWK